MNYYFERIGATSAQVKASRHAPTPLISTPHSRRRVSMTTYQWGDVIDNDDKLKVLINPESEYVIAAKNAFGRVKDDIIIAGILGLSYAGSDGQTTVSLPSTGGTAPQFGQYVADTSINNDSTLDTGTSDNGNMSPQRLRMIKYIFDSNDVDPDEERYVAMAPSSIANMLSHVQVTSADYNTVKALADGALGSYMGFKPIMSNRIPQVNVPSFSGITYPPIASVSTANDRLCMAWAQNGVGLAVQEEVKTEIAKDPSLSFAVRLYMEMVMGATRVEEARVVIAPTKDA